MIYIYIYEKTNKIRKTQHNPLKEKVHSKLGGSRKALDEAVYKRLKTKCSRARNVWLTPRTSHKSKIHSINNQLPECKLTKWLTKCTRLIHERLVKLGPFGSVYLCELIDILECGPNSSALYDVTYTAGDVHFGEAINQTCSQREDAEVPAKDVRSFRVRTVQFCFNEVI